VTAGAGLAMAGSAQGSSRPAQAATVPIAVNLLVGDSSPAFMKSAALPALWAPYATDRLRHRQRIDHAHPRLSRRAHKDTHSAVLDREGRKLEDMDHIDLRPKPLGQRKRTS
jgi:hypothetical protein